MDRYHRGTPADPSATSPAPCVDVACATSSYILRPCPPWHIPRVARLHRRCFRIPYDVSAHLYHWLCDPRGFELVWRRQEVVAFCIARPMQVAGRGRVGEIVAIGVAAEERRQGLARWLLRRALARFWSLQLEEAHLQVRVSNRPAQRLYEELGFQRTRRLIGYYADGEDGFMMVRTRDGAPARQAPAHELT